MIKAKYLFIILSLSIDVVVYSQTKPISYSGKIVDSSSEVPVPYVLLFLKNSTVGNVTNEEGDFLITIPTSSLNDTLVFSHIGYSDLEIPLKILDSWRLGVLKLELVSLQLEQVEVSAKRISAEDVMNHVRENRKKNFTTNPFKLEGYYKHKLKVDGEEQAFVEVALDMIDQDFKPYKYKNGVAKEEIILKGIRKNMTYDDDYAALIQAIPTHDFLNNMLIINRPRRGMEHLTLQYEIDTVTYYQGNLTYVILATLDGAKPEESFWKIRLYVNSDDYAIHRYESLMDHRNYGIKVFDQILNDSLKNKPVNLKRIIEFRKQRGHYYPFYYQFSGSDIVENIVTGKERLYEYSNELLLFDLSLEDISQTKSTRTKANLIDKKFANLTYDSAFWKNYNHLKLTDHEIETNFIDGFNSKSIKNSDYQWSFSKGDTLLGSWNEFKSNYDVTHYTIDIDVDPATETIKGKVIFSFNMITNSDKIQFDLNSQFKISAINWSSQDLQFTRDHNAVFVHFIEDLNVNESYQIEVKYSGSPLKPDLSIPQYGAFVWTEDQESNYWFQSICQGSGANGWWPVKDHFMDKADSIDLIVTVPNEGELVANGQLISKRPVSKDRIKYHWKITYPILSYNVAINYGKYQKLTLQEPGVEADLALYKLQSSTDVDENDVQNIENIVKVYEDYFGSYPFARDGLKVVETPYPMEHQGCIAIGNSYDQELITHEIAHEWWGNSVSCTDYADLWIHESFATYAESLFIEATEGYEASQNYLEKKKNAIRNQRSLIGNYGVNDIHYDISDLYNKGALIWNTLRVTVGNDSIWFTSLKSLQQSFRYKNITTNQLVDFFSSVLDQDLDGFFQVFLNEKELPELEIKMMEEIGGTSVEYRWNKPNFHLPIKVIKQNKAYELIYPNDKWQVSIVEGLKPKDLEIQKKGYLFSLKIN